MPSPSRCDVLLLNDDDTPMEFVVMVLQRFFEMTYDDACTLMLRVHNEGKAICGTYSLEEAETKVAAVLALSAERKHPLQCILKEAD